MYSRIRLEQLRQWTGGEASPKFPADEPVLRISTDSRSIEKGDVFVALKGDSFDGHSFIADVARKGAVAAIVRKSSRSSLPQIKVPDTLQAMVRIAEQMRARFKGPVFAVTGSAGKSSTKDMVAAFMGPETVASPASYNNLLGVSKTIFLLSDTTRALVLEMGMNARGEIAEMCRHFRPQGGLITNIGDAHIGKLGSKREIQLAKKELFDALATEERPLGVALNIDDLSVVEAYKEAFPRPPVTLTYSDQGQGADVRIASKAVDPTTGFLSLKLEVKGKILQEKVPIFGSHHSQNIAAAAAAATLMGVSLDDLRERLGAVRPAPHRGEVHRLDEERILIDESYNSNPTALQSSLNSLFGLAPDRRRVLVLGDMLELGEFGERLHREVGEAVVKLQARSQAPVLAVGVGTLVAHLIQPLKKSLPEGDCLVVPRWEDALEVVRKRLRPRDILFVKGSRGNRLDRLVGAILTEN